ncbi:hypothetical protein GCM10025868_16440 [Angustibacter aerolatus]|uniref:Uncharacterized protein n=1 Tax=Angustibacter aerolatus TaxID=1162965 RepID=A0ABQ6JG72_9ACTN|nr:hypothetical protein GCM10025868_16440 [Angustibacter aerolatus]
MHDERRRHRTAAHTEQRGVEVERAGGPGLGEQVTHPPRGLGEQRLHRVARLAGRGLAQPGLHPVRGGGVAHRQAHPAGRQHQPVADRGGAARPGHADRTVSEVASASTSSAAAITRPGSNDVHNRT